MILHFLLFIFISLSTADVFWTDWKEKIQENGVTKYRGEIKVTRPDKTIVTVEVKFSNPIGIAFFQYDCTAEPYDWWIGGAYYSETAPNRPTACEMIRLQYAGLNTLEFSRPIGEPIFAFESLNRNGYGFDKDFKILSSGEAAKGNCGYWGCGTAARELHDGESYPYWLVGSGEPHGTLQFLGSFDKLVWESLSNENWNGFTLAIAGLAEDTVTGQPCDDEVCQTWARDTVTGACVYTDIVCESDQCSEGVCVEETGECELRPKSGTPCDDGLYCTDTDTCDIGVCIGNPIVCPPHEDQCQAGDCDEYLGECYYYPKDDFADCEDGDLCTQGDTCQAGVCKVGSSIYCESTNPCLINGKCLNGACTYESKKDNSACDDRDYSTIDDYCYKGECKPGKPVVCGPPAQCQKPATVNKQTGICQYDSLPDGTACEDGNACTGDDTCSSGICVTGSKRFCCRTSGSAGKCGLCVSDCTKSYQSVLMFFGLKGKATNVCSAGGAGDCENKNDICCAPKDQKTTIKYLEDGSCYRSANAY